MNDSHEGLNFVEAVKEAWGTRKRVNAREQAERRAGKSREQRAKLGPPRQPINFRISRDTRMLLEALAAQTGGTMTDVVERAVAEMAKKLNVKGPVL
jgi:hypothetical protein